MDSEGFETSRGAVASENRPSDIELWQALQQGQMAALGTLYDRHVGLVYSIALKTTRNTQDAEDLAQGIFLRLAQLTYDPKRGSLRTFLAVLVRSRSIDLMRSRQRQQNILQTSHLGQHSESMETPTEALDRAESTEEVRNALAQLSENQRQVLHLAYRNGLSQTEIAEQLGAPLGTVKSWARRGLLKLRQSLQDKLEGE
ncbi:MAG: sigma-70 family RNA polymerase sigma factor [Oscillatoriales cyanobacterium RM2_1_1]|nr:sigma-70 family RNA polymerase sigma factor [Oscillatoriales cyanobacterium SM2_3_0]NJO47916.1 sigma-70 family RNA polymerase sigma factor [Oscillatoriales cyanobacterium RM2_1_1]